MIVTCPECLTKFSLDGERIPERGARARCSRCLHVFFIQKEKTPEMSFPSPEVPRAEPEEIPKSARPSGKGLHWVKWLILILVLAGVGAGVVLHLRGEKILGKITDLKELSMRISALEQYFGEKAGHLRKAVFSVSFLRQYLGSGNQPEGFIDPERMKGYYVENAVLGKIFIIEGRVANHWGEARSFIKVKGILLDAKGRKVKEKEAYCGNILSEKDLKEMPRAAIEKSLSSQFGESLSNVNIPAEKSVPFMIVFPDLSPERTESKPGGMAGQAPAALSEFTVEVVSSQKGSK